MIPYPNINPVALNLFGLKIHWYGIAYAVGILLGMQYLKKRITKWGVDPMDLDSYMGWVIIGIVMGGRLGQVFFYDWAYYQNHLWDIPKTWMGGMSFHGGAYGFLISTLLFCRLKKIDPLILLDHTAPASCIGIGLGRIANFINGEHYGRITDHAWGVIFPRGGSYPRHPSQLYEAFLEGFVLFFITHYALKQLNHENKGRVSGLFVLCYGIFRSLVECVREPDSHIGYMIYGTTWGQWLSLPLIIGGIYYVFRPQLTHSKL
jgi:phosphatidylglycerol:prolipoprotein diacylglycerol transferase